MKNTLITLAAGALSALPLAVSAQKMEREQLPAAVRAAFDKAHPGIVKAKWEKDAGIYEAEFHQAQKRYSLSYDSAGKLLETEQRVEANDLPDKIKSALKKDFADYAIGEAEKSDKDNKTVYEIEARKSGVAYELVFSADGNLVSKDVDKEAPKRHDPKHGHGGHSHHGHGPKH